MRSNGSILVNSRNKDDVGFRAVMALLGCDYELLSYAIGKGHSVAQTTSLAKLSPDLESSQASDNS